MIVLRIERFSTFHCINVFCPSINGMVLTLFYILCFKMRYGVKHQTKIALVALDLTIVYVYIKYVFCLCTYNRGKLDLSS